ncbi:MAG: hypothetical protein ACK562_10555 [Acidobacteriota bacterium]
MRLQLLKIFVAGGGVLLLTAALHGLVAQAQAGQQAGSKRSLRQPAVGAAQDPRPVEGANPTVTLDAAVEESRNRLLNASQTYRQSLEKLLVLQTQDVDRTRSQHLRNQKLLELGLIPRRQLETSEQEMNEALSRQSETARQLESIDHLVAEVRAAEMAAPLAASSALRTGLPLIRFVGSSRWSMADSTRVDAFYRLKFGRSLPISAYGQTETHQRLGFDHHEAIDVAIHPDSTEGQELLLYLPAQGISFIAIREAIAGSATGAHIHIGPPSRRQAITR